MRTVAALYVDKPGPYIGIEGVDVWDLSRDAKQYRGPHPVVAHPPCGPWGRLKHLCTKQDPTCGPRAVEQVRAFGGVLEHPAGSDLFVALGMPKPSERSDAWGGYTIEVCQVDFGHVARKRTWLYLVGEPTIPPMPAPREPTHWVSGGKTTPVPPGIKVCSAQQRRRTPPAFRDFLLAIARSAS